MSWNAYPGGSNHHTSQYPGQQHHNQYQQPPPPQQQYGQQPGGWQQPPHQPPQYGGQQNHYGGPPPPIPPPSSQHSYGSAGYGGGYNSGPPPQQQQYGGNQGRDDYRPAPSHGDFTGPPSGPPPPQMHYNPNGGGMQGGGWQPPQQQGYGQLAGHNRYGPPPGPAPRPIPQGSQHFGPQFQTQQGGNVQPFFQYSQCTGKKKALLIGINYAGTSSELKGCINDVKNLKAFLQSRYGYRDEDMVVLTDDSRDPRAIPTRANMTQAMHWLVQGAQPNDSLFFHYSGHGGLTEDHAGDEESGFDDVIYPVDHKINGHIIDDEMHDIMIKPLPAGCRLTALYDSCHSGTALDLPYVYSTKGVVKEPNMLVEAGQGILGAGMSYMRGDIGGLMSGAMSTFKKIKNGSNAQKLSLETKTSPADVISLSGCKDDQTSADTQEAGKATGAMSYAFISALTAYPNVSFQQLLINIREELAGKYEQKPQLSSSHPMDVTLAWTC